MLLAPFDENRISQTTSRFRDACRRHETPVSASHACMTRILSAPVLCAIVELSGRINLWRTFPACGIHVSYLDILPSVWPESFPTLLRSLSKYWHSVFRNAIINPRTVQVRSMPEPARLTDRTSAAYRHLESYTVVDLVVSFSYLGHDLSFRNIPDSTYGVIVKETARRWENDVTDSWAPALLLEFLERSNSLAVEHDCWI